MVEFIEIFPSTDFHLIKGDEKFAFELYYFFGGRWVDYESLPESKKDLIITYRPHSNEFPKTFSIEKEDGIYFMTPGTKLGESFAHIEFVDKFDPDNIVSYETIIRVALHEKIEDFCIGNNHITVYEGESNYRISVYAKFPALPTSDSEFYLGDITSHPFLNFRSGNPDLVEVDGSGLITGIEETIHGPVSIFVSHEFSSVEKEVKVTVKPSLDRAFIELNLIHGPGNKDDRNNILFLSEGFTLSDKPWYEKLVTKITNRLFSENNSPFHHLTENFNVWAAFEPCSEVGITENWPLWKPPYPEFKTYWISNDGPSREDTIWNDRFLSEVKDSNFGLNYHLRFGDLGFREKIGSTPVEEEDWGKFIEGWNEIREKRKNKLEFDKRRYSYDWNPYLDTKEEFFRKFIKACSCSLFTKKYKDEKFRNVNEAWKDSSAKDWNLKIILINDVLEDGVFYDGHLILVTLGTCIDHIPNTVPTRECDIIGFRSIPQATFPLIIDKLSSTIAHELGHAFLLGDEYENVEREPEFNEFDPTKDYIEEPNLISHDKITTGSDTSPIFDFEKVPWFQWPRIKACSILIKDAININEDPDTGESIQAIQCEVDLKSGRDLKFKHFISAGLLSLWLGSFSEELRTFQHEGPFEIHKIKENSPESIFFFLKGELSNEFLKGSLLYLPKTEGEGVMYLVRPDVKKYLMEQDAPFGGRKAPDTCHIINSGPNKADEKFSADDLEYLVGIFEGGRYYNCKVYRPSGKCRMREDDINKDGSYVPFCHVCQYVLTQKINPAKLGENGIEKKSK